jgi:adenosylhomocysteine nucleosidase
MPFANRKPGVPDLLYVMAVDAEYGPHLKARISPILTGVGPVEAAVVLTHELARREAAGTLPQLVVSLGSAGSSRLEQGAIYQATSVAYRDMDASPLGFEIGVTPFLGLPAVLPLGPFVPGVAKATLSTGANIVSGGHYSRIDAQMVDMETFAVLRACQRFKLPLIALRGISDGDEDLGGGLTSWTQYLHIVDEHLAAAVDRLEAAVAEGTLEYEP